MKTRTMTARTVGDFDAQAAREVDESQPLQQPKDDRPQDLQQERASLRCSSVIIRLREICLIGKDSAESFQCPKVVESSCLYQVQKHGGNSPLGIFE